MNFYNSVP